MSAPPTVRSLALAVAFTIAASAACGGSGGDASSSSPSSPSGSTGDDDAVDVDGGGVTPTSACPPGKALTAEGDPTKTTRYTTFVADKPYELTRVDNVTYAARGGFTLQGDWFFPTALPKPAPGILVMVHGGGWKDCDNRRKSSESIAELWAAAAGVAVFNVEYRLLGEGGAFPENLRDVHCALRFARKDAVRHGIDGSRMVLMGDSAGAHLVATASLTVAREDLQDSSCGEAAPNVVGTIGFSGVYDLPLFAKDPEFPNAEVGKQTSDSPGKLVSDYVGACVGTITACDEGKSATPCVDASPSAHACAAVGPFLLVQAPDGLDPLVPLAQATSFRDVLSAAGKQVTLVVPPRSEMEALNSGGPICTPELSHGYSPCLVFPTIDPVAKLLLEKLR